MGRKSYYCKKLENTLNFTPDYIKFCCSCAFCPGLKIEDFNNIDKKALLKEKTRIINLLENGIIPRECEGCIDYKEKAPLSFWQKFKKRKDKISFIVVNHFKECDCSCIYCSQKLIYKEATPVYKLAPIIRDLYQKDLIDKDNLEVEFQGGNVSVLKEFDEIVTILSANHCKSIRILTNGIKYLPILEEIQKTTPVELVISLDAGTNETFKQIKQVDKLNDVIENIKRYEQFSNIAFSLKYIIIKGANDNIEELHHFLDIAKNVSPLYNLNIEIDYRDTLFKSNDVKFIVPKHYYEMIDFAKKYTQENNIHLNINPYPQMVLDKGEV